MGWGVGLMRGVPSRLSLVSFAFHVSADFPVRRLRSFPVRYPCIAWEETASPSLGGRRRVVAVTALSTRQRAPRADDHRHVGSDLLLLHLNNEQLVIGSFEPRRCSAPPSTPSGVTVTQQLLGRRTKASQGAGNPSELARAASTKRGPGATADPHLPRARTSADRT